MSADSLWRPLMIAAAAVALLAVGLLAAPRRKWGWGAGALAVSIGIGALLARGDAANRVPIQNLFEATTTLAVLAGVIGLAIGALRRDARPLGVGLAAMGLTLTAALLAPVPGRAIEREAPILDAGALLVLHVGMVLVGYACITVGFGASVAYLAASARRKPAGGFDRLQSLCANLAFITLGAGILLGAVWADRAWGRWWAFDPKETWALITWGVYLALVHLRLVLSPPRKGPITALLSILGFALMLWSLIGVNLFLSGLHSYA